MAGVDVEACCNGCKEACFVDKHIRKVTMPPRMLGTDLSGGVAQPYPLVLLVPFPHKISNNYYNLKAQSTFSALRMTTTYLRSTVCQAHLQCLKPSSTTTKRLLIQNVVNAKHILQSF